MRMVLDTNVVVSALLWDGRPGKLLRAGRNASLRFVTSAPLIAELTETLSRGKFQDQIAASSHSLDELVDGYVAYTLVVRPVAVPRLAPDPDDDVVIGTAIAGAAELEVTGDRTLLHVGAYDDGRIVSVAHALEALGLV